MVFGAPVLLQYGIDGDKHEQHDDERAQEAARHHLYGEYTECRAGK